MAHAGAIAFAGRGNAAAAVNTLVVGPAWVGDMVIAQALVAALQEDGVAVHVLAPPATLPVAERMPGLAATHRLDAGHGELALRARWRLGRALRGIGLHRAIVLPNTLKSALTPWFAGIPQRTGWRGEHRYGLLNDLRRPDAQRWPRMIDRFVALAEAPRVSRAALKRPSHPLLQPQRGNLRRALRRIGLGLAGSVVALCPGAAFGPAKRWPAQHFSEVARRSIAAGHQVWLFGAAEERPLCEAIAANAPGAVSLAGRTSLGDAIDLLSAAHCVVANDSGLMHVAAALGRPVVALFGSTSPDFTPPLGAQTSILQAPQPCSPCFQRRCPLGHTRCLEDLAPLRVWREVCARLPRLARAAL